MSRLQFTTGAGHRRVRHSGIKGGTNPLSFFAIWSQLNDSVLKYLSASAIFRWAKSQAQTHDTTPGTCTGPFSWPPFPLAAAGRVPTPAPPPERLTATQHDEAELSAVEKINVGIARRLAKGEALVIFPGALVLHKGDTPAASVAARALNVPGLFDVLLLACTVEVDRVHDLP